MRVNSSGDMLGLVAELNTRRIAMITGKMAKRAGGRLDLPKRTIDLLSTARRLHHRYMQGDYRHDVAETDRLRDLCQWLVSQHKQLEGRPEDGSPIAWNAPALSQKDPLPPESYRQLVGAIHDGQIDDIADPGQEGEA
jgi:hypothetical protein